jgi:hypothetical protein
VFRSDPRRFWVGDLAAETRAVSAAGSAEGGRDCAVSPVGALAPAPGATYAEGDLDGLGENPDQVLIPASGGGRIPHRRGMEPDSTIARRRRKGEEEMRRAELRSRHACGVTHDERRGGARRPDAHPACGGTLIRDRRESANVEGPAPSGPFTAYVHRHGHDGPPAEPVLRSPAKEEAPGRRRKPLECGRLRARPPQGFGVQLHTSTRAGDSARHPTRVSRVPRLRWGHHGSSVERDTCSTGGALPSARRRGV